MARLVWISAVLLLCYVFKLQAADGKTVTKMLDLNNSTAKFMASSSSNQATEHTTAMANLNTTHIHTTASQADVTTSTISPKSTTINAFTNGPNTTTHITTQAPNTTHITNITTHAPNTTHITNITTHAPNTTHITNITTHAPNTTHITNITTHAPNTTHITNITTHAPNTTTPSHTTLPTPTLAPKPSPPESGTYIVKNNNATCIKASFGLELQLYNSTKAQGYYNIIPNKTHATGTCEDKKANLNVTFAEGFINFGFVQDQDYYYIKEIDVFFVLSSETWRVNVSDEKLLHTENGYYVKCKNTPNIKFKKSVELVMADVKLQAFDFHGGEFGKGKICSYDSNVIALAIGITVVLIVIIGVIIYLIWHKKKSSGYQRI